MVIAWLVLGLVLLVVEVRHLAFYALFGAVGAFAAAGVAVVSGSAIPLQVGAAVVVATVGIVALRPVMKTTLTRADGSRPGRGVHGSLVGQEVVTLDTVGDGAELGHVRLAGERWLAVSGSGQRIPSGVLVLVTAVQGTTLVVWPVDGNITFLDHRTGSVDPSVQAEGDEHL